MKKILLKWIDITLASSIYLNQDNFESYMSNTEKPFEKLYEYQLRSQLLSVYLEKPEDKTIINFLEEKKYNLIDYGHSNVEKRVFNKVVKMFNLRNLQF